MLWYVYVKVESKTLCNSYLQTYSFHVPCVFYVFQHSQKDRIPFGTEDLLREPQFKKSNILKTKQAVLTASENFDKVRAATGVTEANVRALCIVCCKSVVIPS